MSHISDVFIRNDYSFIHACTRCSELPSNISTLSHIILGNIGTKEIIMINSDTSRAAGSPLFILSQNIPGEMKGLLTGVAGPV